MATTIILYPGCKISKDRNAKIENITSYLATTYPLAQILTIQYQKIELNMKLKLALDQKYAAQPRCNYAMINQDNKNYYFFVNGANWKSTNTVEFDLELDTVNTFASDFTFNKKTHITRQHKDRLEKTSVNYEYIPEEDLDSTPREKIEYRITGELLTADNDIINTADISTITLREYNRDGTLNNTYTGHTFKFRNTQQDYQLIAGSGLQEHVEWQIDASDLINEYNAGEYYTIEIDTDGAPEDMEWRDFSWDMFDGVRQYINKRIIDMKPEEINPPLFKTNDYMIYETGPFSPSTPQWYLLYRTNVNTPTTVDCYVLPGGEFDILKYYPSTFSISPEDLTADVYYYIMPQFFSLGTTSDKFCLLPGGNYFNISLDYSDGSSMGQIINNQPRVQGRSPVWYVISKYGSTSIEVREYTCIRVRAHWETRETRRFVVSSIAFSNVGPSNLVRYYSSTTVYDSWTKCKNNLVSAPYYYWDLSPTAVSVVIQGVNKIDRTDSKNLKLIEIPYRPFTSYKDENGQYIWNLEGFSIETDDGKNYLKLANLIDGKFETNLLYHDYANPFKPLLYTETSSFSLRDLRNDELESKIYNSEFYNPKFVYDSFSYNFNLENVDIDNIEDINNLDITYKVTNTINSRFMFQFNHPLKRDVNDYSNLCIVNRNNEMPLYNSDYLNYIRTGYNYDVKNKQLNLATSALGIGTGAAHGGVSVALAMGSKAGPYGALAGAAIGIVGGIINTAISQSQADLAIKRKLDEKAQQATSVQGSDDIDLLNKYTNKDKAKIVTYQCSDKVKQTMLDLFYYGGYAEDVREVPNTNTRQWFNFLQCEPVFNEESTTPYYEFLSDIKRRYNEGVTIYHRNGSGTDIDPYEWDWDQKYANYETSLFSEGE